MVPSPTVAHAKMLVLPYIVLVILRCTNYGISLIDKTYDRVFLMHTEINVRAAAKLIQNFSRWITSTEAETANVNLRQTTLRKACIE